MALGAGPSPAFCGRLARLTFSEGAGVLGKYSDAGREVLVRRLRDVEETEVGVEEGVEQLGHWDVASPSATPDAVREAFGRPPRLPVAPVQLRGLAVGPFARNPPAMRKSGQAFKVE
jgi:hypothetical protein